MRVRKLPNFMCRRLRKSRYVVQFVLLAVSFLSACTHSNPQDPRLSRPTKVQITVVDENDVAVPSARVLLRSSPTADGFVVIRISSADVRLECHAGNVRIASRQTGILCARRECGDRTMAAVEVHLSHFQEVRERVDVVESAPAIDPTQVASTEQLTASDVLDIPSSVARLSQSVELHPGRGERQFRATASGGIGDLPNACRSG